jgi:hypothetical protein
MGLLRERGILNLFFNNSTFRNSPTSPGINCNAKPDTYIIKLLFNGISILFDLSKICQRANKINQPDVTRIKIRGKNSNLRFINASEINARSDKDIRIE